MITYELELTKVWTPIISNDAEREYTISNVSGGRITYCITDTVDVPALSIAHTLKSGEYITGNLKYGQYLFLKSLDEVEASIVYSKISNTIVTQGYIEQNIKVGKQFEFSNNFAAIAAGVTCGFKITTGAKPIILKGSNITTDAQSFVSRIMNGVTATDGASIPVYNLNDILNPLPSLSTVKVVSAISGGTDCFAPIYQKISTGGTSGTSTVRGGGAVIAGLEKVLKPNTTYYFTFQNAGTAAADISFYGTFYEGEYVI